MNEYTTKPQINIFEGISTSRTMANKGIPDFALPKKNDASILANDLLPLHNKKDDRFQTDVQLNGKTRFEEKNTIIKSLEEEIVNMKHKLSFVYEKDEEIGKLKDEKDNKSLLGDYITNEELWACTTCNACTDACPINLDPLSIIVDLRRYLVMEESAAPTELNNMFSNVENNGAPWQFPAADRLKWLDENN